MTKRIWLAGLAFVLTAGVAAAQDTRADEQDAAREQPRRTLRVLEDPYDIASFYRSSQSSDERYFSYQSPYDFSDRYPIAGHYRNRQSADDFGGRYPIASHYRNRQSRRGAGFVYWSGRRRAPRGVVGYRRKSNADLFLVVPTFLAPVGPLTSSFFGER